MNINKVRKYVEFAIQVANRAPINQRYRVGCVIVSGNTPISVGFNDMKKTHPRAVRFRYPFIHAEVAALIGISDRDLKGAMAFVARVRKLTRTGLAKPCCSCEYELRRVGIRKVWYTTYTEDIGCLIL
jgi:deoxycytidylate deaminase